ncbi:MAG TPA: aminoglycoside phosphotransferase family protein [Kribbella sp.]|nr:aminoglycoside phosphotransferase family protein [Kribbella sp.]
MRLHTLERPEDAFQQSLSGTEILAICRRAFGEDVRATGAVELGLGGYNTVYRVELESGPVILRVAPRESVQYGSERQLMRNEYAATPWLAVIAPLMPRILAVDWSHDVVDRDWMIQSCLSGLPAPEHLGHYPRSGRTTFFRQLGAITRTVHDVPGPHFGPPAGPTFTSWSALVIDSFEQIADDLEHAGLDADDVRTAATIATRDRQLLDEIREPRLLTGDLWTVNCMLDADAPEPLISGVLDFDRAEFGDPAADWTIRMAQAKTDERKAFWDAYGPLDRSPEATHRARIYEARHLAAIRLERHRLANPTHVRETYPPLANLLTTLT